VKITIRNFQKKIPINPKRIKATIRKVLSAKPFKKPGEITVCFVNDRSIKQLNLIYLHKNNPTDVLTFDISGPLDKKRITADIVISTDTVIHNAKIFKTSFLYELHLYIVHGLLHILGFDDKNATQRKLMDRATSRILAKLRLGDGDT